MTYDFELSVSQSLARLTEAVPQALGREARLLSQIENMSAVVRVHLRISRKA